MYATRFAAAARLRRFTYMATKKREKKEKCKNRGDVFYRNQKKIGGGSKTRIPILVTFFSGFVCLLSLFFLSFLLLSLILSPLPSDAIGFGFL